MRYLLFSLVFLASCSSNHDHEKKEKLLFVVHSQTALIANGKLTLMNVSPDITFFADRPVRQAGQLDIHSLLKLWDPKAKGGFSDNPPNAGFVFYEDKNQKYREITVELLKQPLYQNGNLIFDIKDFSDQSVANQHLTDVSLFIDPATVDVPVGKNCHTQLNYVKVSPGHYHLEGYTVVCEQ